MNNSKTEMFLVLKTRRVENIAIYYGKVKAECQSGDYTDLSVAGVESSITFSVFLSLL